MAILAITGVFFQINIVDDTQLRVTTFSGYNATFETVSVANFHKVDTFIYKHLGLIIT